MKRRSALAVHSVVGLALACSLGASAAVLSPGGPTVAPTDLTTLPPGYTGVTIITEATYTDTHLTPFDLDITGTAVVAVATDNTTGNLDFLYQFTPLYDPAKGSESDFTELSATNFDTVGYVDAGYLTSTA